MTSNAPNFASTFEIVGEKLTAAEKLSEAEKRLESRRSRLSEKTQKQPCVEPREKEKNLAREREERKLDTSMRKRKPSANSSIQIVTKEPRQTLNLKVLATNEAKFRQLFHSLQLKGDSRKKQDLGDEALELLFAKYAKLLTPH